MKRKIFQGETQEIRKLIIDNCDFFFVLLWGHERPELQKQVRSEHSATLITLLADREVQL